MALMRAGFRWLNDDWSKVSIDDRRPGTTGLLTQEDYRKLAAEYASAGH